MGIRKLAFATIMNRLATLGRRAASALVRGPAARGFQSTTAKRMAEKPVWEKSWFQQWFTEPASYPIIVICAGAVAFAGWKLMHDSKSPDTHWKPSTRSTLDYVENEVDPKKA